MEGFSYGKDQKWGMQPWRDLSCRDAQTPSLSQGQVLLTADCLGKQTKVCKILIPIHFLKVSKLQNGDSTENAEDLQSKYFNPHSIKCYPHFCGRNVLDLPSPQISQSTEGWYPNVLFLPAGILAFLLIQTCTKAPLDNKTSLSGWSWHLDAQISMPGQCIQENLEII